MDKIKLNKMEFYAYHGLFQEERVLGQRFFVDLELHLSLNKAGKSDDMNDSVHYGEVYETVKTIVETKMKNLVEAVAEEIAMTVLERFSLVDACLVQVTKPDPPIRGHYESVAVEIYRERER